MLKLITYNIAEGKQLDKILRWIELEQNNVDIICLQEYPQKELKIKNKFFKNYYQSYSPGLKKRGVQLGELTLFSKNLKLIEEYTLELGHDELEILYKKIPTKRSALITTFEINNKQFIVGNIHLSAFSFNLNRRRQLKRIISGIASTVPTVILGDFNYSNFFGRNFFIEYMEGMGLILAGDKMITNKYKKILNQQLDYVFYTGFELSDISVKKLPFSDHYPVIVNFKKNE